MSAMTKWMVRSLTAMVVAAGSLMSLAGPDQASAAPSSTLIVDDDRRASLSSCDATNLTHGSVRAAVNAAAAGDSIRVCPGTYAQQVVIPRFKDSLRLTSVVDRQAIIQAPPTFTNSGSLVEVRAKDVLIEGFTIRGPIPDSVICAGNNHVVGVRFEDDGSGALHRNRITEIRSASLAGRGCPNGDAVFGSDGGSLDLFSNTIDAYQRGGIVARNTLRVRADGNRIDGNGPLNGLSRVGVVIGGSMEAVLEHNTVSGNSIGLWLIDLPNRPVQIRSNTLLRNDTNLFLQNADGTHIVGNVVRDARLGAGVLVDAGSTGNVFGQNRVSGSAGFDCHDQSTGTGTTHTANAWSGNGGTTSSPLGICAP